MKYLWLPFEALGFCACVVGLGFMAVGGVLVAIGGGAEFRRG